MKETLKRLSVYTGIAIPYNLIVSLLTDNYIIVLIASMLIVLSVDLVRWGLDKDK